MKIASRIKMYYFIVIKNLYIISSYYLLLIFLLFTFDMINSMVFQSISIFIKSNYEKSSKLKY